MTGLTRPGRDYIIDRYQMMQSIAAADENINNHDDYDSDQSYVRVVVDEY